MGVDIGTYRSRIGTFRQGSGSDVVFLKMCLNYTGNMKVVGVVTFIGMLLIMAGVESNPGPPTKDPEQEAEPINTILKNIGLTQYIDIFKKQEITVDIINDLTDVDYKDIGVETVGHRVRIRKACGYYKAEKYQENHSEFLANRRSKSDVQYDIENSSDASIITHGNAKDNSERSKHADTDFYPEDGNIDIAQSSEAPVSLYTPGLIRTTDTSPNKDQSQADDELDINQDLDKSTSLMKTTKETERGTAKVNKEHLQTEEQKLPNYDQNPDKATSLMETTQHKKY